MCRLHCDNLIAIQKKRGRKRGDDDGDDDDDMCADIIFAYPTTVIDDMTSEELFGTEMDGMCVT